MNKINVIIASLLLSSFLFTQCGGDDNAPVPPPTILAPTVAGLFQPEGQLTVSFTITGTYTDGNTFTAQLSDGTGSFDNPTVIGTLASLTAGTINATLPASIANGTAYRIRVVASAPATTSPDNGSNLSIAAPTLAISSFNTSPQAGVTYIGERNVAIVTASTGTFASNNVFRIQLSDASGSFTSPTNLYEGATLSPTTIVTLPANIAVGSGYKFRITSTSPAINSTPTAAFNVVALAFSAPAISGNIVLDGAVSVSTTISNGPTPSGNFTFRVQLSDASGNFTNPVNLVSLVNPSTTQTNNFNMPITLTPGNGYKLRAVLEKTGNVNLYTGPSSAAFTIGALPTITISETTPVFTRMYSAQTSALSWRLFYSFNVQTTGSFNPNTTFAFSGAAPGQPFSSAGIGFNGLVASTLLANGSVIAFVGLNNFSPGSSKFRVIALGHNVVSNEKIYNVTSTTLSSATASIDNVNYNFELNKSLSNNASTLGNNVAVYLVGDANYNLHGAPFMRTFITMPLTNEVIATGTKNITVFMQLLNSSGQLLSQYSFNAVSATITGDAVNGFSGTLGSATLTRTSGTTGPTTLAMQSGSFSFKMQ
jgi:hypothetical protein